MLHFTKMNGAGNDFVMVDNREGNLTLSRETIERLCDRHRGIGADGLLALEPAVGSADFRMRYYNSDGGEAEMCGNGARCFARFTHRLAGPRERISFETQAGVITASFIGDQVRLAMSQPKDLKLNHPIEIKNDAESGMNKDCGGASQSIKQVVHSINTGVPHAVMIVPDIEIVPVQKLGAAIRFHPDFAPKGTNANFIQASDPQTITIRTYERGVEAKTLACGTGVTASAIIFHELTGANSPVSVRVRGGDCLEVGFEMESGVYTNVTLTGPADFVFDGEIAL